jgi:intraflagellar transport protein 172
MVRLVGKFRRDLLKDTHINLAQTLESNGNLKQAEHHYVEADLWINAVEMYKVYENWEDSIRVAKAHGN